MKGINKDEFYIILLISIFFFNSLFMTAGCSTVKEHSVTYQVWDYKAHYEPADKVNMQIYRIDGTNEFLVQYDEKREHRNTSIRRSFLLKENVGLLKNQEKPEFLSESEIDKLVLIQVKIPGFGIYDLPDYYDRNLWEDIRCMLLTPGAFTVDLLQVSAYIAILGAIGFLSSAHSYSFSP